ncbi:dihydroorotate dehydrogenase electron transfer subunit [Brachyspira hyodysenteriae]|uniref:dihydroorotate dehydrogenase electron transfer subunit n=1 Tax=Brachyspira hyodysenteriae TaxID=159 RepID=UPI00063D8813|nr:dihydroorotate dehydrogenase electron transfer subunit [Brachyspira hyodysenteriae]KLI17961.1 dihydroorotate dehydrogenase [Brachyspira hyodysenteriae]KLI32439.1 dihydroorotate dehydrogenase [Brachyspira hyodysenteriae]KLI44013.1 dihydroorotate dehydrogenase [Brachyspira hyodysenteriae]KLI46346.1 dihydroorotate dehydrogenase [Brachyspira hyodysenteriae]MBT8721054.1 dihydroorotate dehydrogenase electron transfer subunit [Brachyspira hyodysenteriae]
MFLEDCIIIKNIKISNDKYLIRVKSKESYKHAKAGQFFMLKSNTFLRRPISLHYIDNDILEFYYQVKGEGTEYLSKLKENDTINIQGPLGNGFDTNISNKKILIVAGGMGIAPIKLLIEKLNNSNNSITLIMGGADSSAIKIMDRFDTNNIDLHIITDDGSVGDKCNTVDKTKELLKEKTFDIIYTCGPTVMMKALIKVAKENNILCYASLEERMACGVNACLGCNIEIKDEKSGYTLKKVCHDGPVFNGELLNF